MGMQTEQSGGSAVGEKVEQAKDVVSAQTTDAVEKGRGALSGQLDTRSTQLGEQIGSTSQMLRQVASQARQEGNDQHARIAEKAAERTDRLSSFLTEADGEQLLSEAEEFARRQPWVLAGAGFLAGVLLARAMKVSSERRYGTRTQLAPYRPNGARNGAEQWADERPQPTVQPAVVGTPSTGTLP
jgi:ElaB/YqjD/DUF883 family membrane-anchored ribosome-binding protein